MALIPDDVEFIDADTEFQRPEGTTFKEIVLQHITKIGNICTKEFKEGYWEERPVKVGDAIYMTKTYKEDTRDAYTNAVDFLYDLLLPRFDEDKEIKTQIELIDKEMESQKKNCPNDEWKNVRLTYRRKLFQQLSLLLKALNYLEVQAIS